MLFSPKLIPAVFSFAVMAPCSVSYSTKAMPRRPGTSLISRNPSNRPKMIVKASISYSSGKFWTKRILLGGRYSSNTPPDAALLVDFSPDGRADLVGLISGAAPGPLLLSCLCSSAASSALRWSVDKCMSVCAVNRRGSLSLVAYFSPPAGVSYGPRAHLGYS